MMPTTDPVTLRLQSWLCGSFDLARVIANEHRSLAHRASSTPGRDGAGGTKESLLNPAVDFRARREDRRS